MQEVKMVTYRTQSLSSSWPISLVMVIILALIMGMLLAYPIGLSLALATQLVLFVRLFNRPVWAMAALIIGQLTTSSFMITLSASNQLSIRFLWTIMALLILFPVLKSRSGIHLGPQAKRVLIPAIVFFALATISTFVIYDFSYYAQYLRTVATSLTILILLPAAIENERDAKTLALVALLTGLASAAVAVLQHYAYLGMPVFSLTPDAFSSSRAVGLSESPVHIAYQLPMILVPLAAIYLLKGVKPKARQWLLIAAMVIFAGLYFSYTRSGIYALAPGLLAIALLVQGKLRKEMILVMIILAGAFLYITEMRGNRFSAGLEDQARAVLWQAGVRIALDNPVFGIGEDRFMDVSQEYASAVGPQYIEGTNWTRILGTQEVHNDFIRVWVSYGTPTLLAFLWVFVAIFRNFFDAYRASSSRFLKSFALAGFASLATYIASSAVHNMLSSVSFLWILAGLSIATMKLTLAKRNAEGILND